MGGSKRMLTVASIICLLVGLGFGIFLDRSVLNKKGNADVVSKASVTTVRPLLAKALPGAPDRSGMLAVDNGDEYVNAVLDNTIDQMALGLVNAKIKSANATVSSLLDKIIPKAHAQNNIGNCIEVAAEAIKASLVYWLPGGTGPCAELTVKYKAAYEVRASAEDQGAAGGGLVKVTLSQDGPAVLKYKDPSCKDKSENKKFAPRTKYYTFDSYNATGENGEDEQQVVVHPIDEFTYNKLIKDGDTILEPVWCANTTTDTIKIGDISICPRCNKRGGGSGGGPRQ